MSMFDRRQLFVGAALIVLIEIVTAAMRLTLSLRPTSWPS